MFLGPVTISGVYGNLENHSLSYPTDQKLWTRSGVIPDRPEVRELLVIVPNRQEVLNAGEYRVNLVGQVPEPELNRFIRGVKLARGMTGRAQVLAKEWVVYAVLDVLKAVLIHRFRTIRPTKAVRKTLESLYQQPKQGVRSLRCRLRIV